MSAISLSLGIVNLLPIPGLDGGKVLLLIIEFIRKKKINEDLITDLIFNTIIWAVIGARLYYVVFNWELYASNPVDVFKVWEGGLAIHGGILFGLAFVIFYTKKHKYNIIKMMDMASVALIVGQIIGRWGNFFNQEAHGPATSLETLKSFHLPNFIIKGMNINGIYYHPTFLYESSWNLVGLAIMLIIRRRKNIKIGQISGFYMIWYGIGRYFIEALRTDSLMLFNFRISQIMKSVKFSVGAVWA